MWQLDRRMRRPTFFGRLSLLLAGGLLTACDQRAESVATTDSLLARDLTLAAAAAPALVPNVATLGDTAVAPPVAPPMRPTAPTPAPRPRPRPVPAPTPAPAPVPAPPTAVLPAPLPAPAPLAAATGAEPANAGAGNAGRSLGVGTSLTGTTNAAICSLANRPGDRLVATLTSDVTGPDGARVPAGTPLLVEMAPPTAAGDFVFRVKGVQINGALIPAEGTVDIVDGAPTERKVSKGGDQGKVITGAVMGAILGRVLGGGTRGTVIGAAAGGAAGSISAARNTTTERCLPLGATLRITLNAPLMLPSSTP